MFLNKRKLLHYINVISHVFHCVEAKHSQDDDIDSEIELEGWNVIMLATEVALFGKVSDLPKDEPRDNTSTMSELFSMLQILPELDLVPYEQRVSLNVRETPFLSLLVPSTMLLS